MNTDLIIRMGKERRKEPGTENKNILSCPGPTAYNLPSKVNCFLFHITSRSKKDLRLQCQQNKKFKI